MCSPGQPEPGFMRQKSVVNDKIEASDGDLALPFEEITPAAYARRAVLKKGAIVLFHTTDLDFL